MIKFISFIVVLLLAFAVWQMPSLQEKPEVKKANNSIKQDEHSQTDTHQQNPKKKPAKKTPDWKKQQSFIDEEDIDLILEITDQKRYSDDPFIEFVSRLFEIETCKTDQKLTLIESNAKKDYSIFKKLRQGCDDLIAQAPILGKYNDKTKILPLMMSDIMQSSYRDQFFQLIFSGNKKQMPELLFNTAMQSKSSQLIARVDNIRSLTHLTEDIAATLGTNRIDYINLIGKQALHFYACQLQNGITCTATSTFMINKCIKDPNLCGKDSHYWYKNHITDGHRADIDLIVDLLAAYQD